MHELEGRLNVVTRIRAAMLAHKTDRELATMSVSAICRAAGVSRANLYVSHPELLREIRGWGAKEPTKNKLRVELAAQLKAEVEKRKLLQDRFDALLTVCVEMQAEIMALRARCVGTKGRKR